MKLLLIEDIYPQGEWLEEQLKETFRCQILWIETESEFRSDLKKIEALSPDVAVIDVMLKWADAEPGMSLPPVGWERYEAGLRCQALLAENEGTRGIPVIFYTILSREDLAVPLPEFPPGVSHVAKDSNLEPLFRRIREVTAP
jgi:hypothetical protein